jgi:hypothetical protein
LGKSLQASGYSDGKQMAHQGGKAEGHRDGGGKR